LPAREKEKTGNQPEQQRDSYHKTENWNETYVVRKEWAKQAETKYLILATM
jgi:hypothetical protein